MLKTMSNTSQISQTHHKLPKGLLNALVSCLFPDDSARRHPSVDGQCSIDAAAVYLCQLRAKTQAM